MASHLWSRPALFRRVLIADDHKLVAEGVRHLLLGFCELVDVVYSGESLLESVRRFPPQVVIADVSMPGISGIEAMNILHFEGGTTPFVFLTMHNERAMAAAVLRDGGRGYVPKTAAADELFRALQEVSLGRNYVSPSLADSDRDFRVPIREATMKQQRILECLSRGLQTGQIAHVLGISKRTVESHKYAMMRELGAQNTIELLRKAEAEGWLRR